MGRYDEVVHNLAFVKELQNTLGALTQDVRFVRASHLKASCNPNDTDAFLLT